MNHIIRVLYTAAAILFVTAGAATAANYYIDPATGAIGNDGSQGSPWNTLEAVASAKTFSPGDTVFCLSGYHGTAALTGEYASPVVYKAAAGAVPRLRKLSFSSAENIVVDGFTITASAAPTYQVIDDMVYLPGGVTYTTVQNCSIYSVLDASGWTEDNWDYSKPDVKVCAGIELRGHHCTIKNNYITNVRFGARIISEATYNLVEHNTINRFSEDGMRLVGNYNTVQYNLVKNGIVVNDRHVDGTQSWAVPRDGTASRKGMVIRGNQYIIWEKDGKTAYHDYMMGLGCHDGMFEDWVVENNLVVTSATVGMQLLGAINCRVVNNTVITVPGGSKDPWIYIGNHKNGTASTGCVIRNNLASVIKSDAGVTVDHNLTGALGKVLVNDYNNYDFSLKAAAAMAIDAGSDDLAPATDIVGTPRPAGAVDIGCYEYAATGIAPAGYINPDVVLKDIRLGPLPVTERSTLSFTADRAGNADIAIRTLDGAQVWSQNIPTAAGANRLSLSALRESPGLYVYELSFDGTHVAQGYFVVQ